MRINSPGGSPVQAGYINDEIIRLRAKYPDRPLYAVISDICASGGYYIAAAADKIYANKASIVGSIGVVMASFGYVDAIEKLGIERRLLHAGENKGFLDFAGSTVVHSIGGWCALAGAIVLGPRIGKYSKKGVMPIPGHNIPLAALGVFILWLGWFGFNPGIPIAI